MTATKQGSAQTKKRVSVNEKLMNLARMIRRSGSPEEAQEAAELEQLLQMRLENIQGKPNAA